MPDRAPLHLRFGPFLLEEADARLTRDGRAIELVPKAYGVLCHLAARPGRLVTKDELLDAVWGHRHISESVLKSAVKTIRAGLGDDAQAPRYVETVHRRGYRFIGNAAAPAAPSSDVPTGAGTAPALPATLIGRERELARLHAAWQQACAGQRRLVLLAGDPGIGKSSLADRWARACAASGTPVRVGRGPCVDQVGADAAYLPMLEALNAWCADDAALPALLRQVAPTWLQQLPWHLPPDERAALQREVAGAGTERMLREMAELLDRLSAVRPVLLVLEDLQWSDAATVRLLDVLARRRGSARLMVLGTYRPTDMLLAEHPLADLLRELRLHGLCEELVLAGLERPAVEAWLVQRLGASSIDGALVAALHRHTDGHPLFLARVVDELIATHTLAHDAGRWSLGPGADATLPLPQHLADVIERQAARLRPDERQVLEAAALCPQVFEAAVVAEAIGQPPEAVTGCLSALARRALWVRRAGPDGTGGTDGSERYSYTHALLRHVLREQVPPARRVEWHQRLGAAIERRHAGRLVGVAAELGLHAEQGLQPGRAATFLSMAAAQAMRRLAPRHALALAERGLARLAAAEPEADSAEALALTLHAQRLLALVATNGYASPQTLAAAREAEAAIDAAPALPHALPLWYGCAWIEIYTGHAGRALGLAQALEARAQAPQPALGNALALTLQGVVAYHGNRYAEARTLLEQALRLLEGEPAGFEAAYVPQSPLLEALAHLGLVQELLGDEAAAAASRARLAGLIDTGMHPLSEGMGSWFLACAHHLRDETETAAALCEQALQKMSAHDANPGKGMHLALLAWARGQQGHAERAVELARAALHERSLQRTRMGHGTLLTCVAGAFLSAHAWEPARTQLDAALAAAQDVHDAFGVTETLRLRGELRWLADQDAEAALADLDRAVALARAQGAPRFEQRALASRARVAAAAGR